MAPRPARFYTRREAVGPPQTQVRHPVPPRRYRRWSPGSQQYGRQQVPLTLPLIAQAAHAVNATAAQKLTASAAFDAARRLQAVHTKWRALLAPPNGSFTTLSSYLQDRASAASDPVVRALAQERLHVIRLIAAMCTSTPTSPLHLAATTVSPHGLAVIYAFLKHLSREIKEAATRSKPEFQVLLSIYGPAIALVDLQPSISRMKLARPSESRTPVVLQENKNRKPATNLTRRPAANSGPRQRSRSPRRPISTTAPAAPSTIDRNSTPSKGLCKNCALSGKAVSHSLNACRQLGNKCLLRCFQCHNGVHWRVDCSAATPARRDSKK